MRHIKSERLKKLEMELNDLEQWLKLGLVPKKDIEKHKEEILSIQSKIQEEKERLHFLKESGDAEEYVTPKRQPPRSHYTEMPTIPDIDAAETVGGLHDTAFDVETQAVDVEHSALDEKEEPEEDNGRALEEDQEDGEEDSYFSDKNRWRRGGIIDPDADEW